MISVIIPAYNAEKFLAQTVASVLSQTYREFELLIVNDGSKDRTLEIAECLAKEDSRIRVFSQKNGGVTSTRRKGVQEANGEWICFVDADDTLPEKALETLIKNSEGFDIVIGQVHFEGKWPYPKIERDFSSGREYVKAMRRIPIHWGPFAKIFANGLFKSNALDLPRELTNGEDFVMNIRLGLAAKRIRVIKDIVYHYADVATSASKKNVYASAAYNVLWYKCLVQSFDSKNIRCFKALLFGELLDRFEAFFKANLRNLLKWRKA